jgi:tetratricopeptide (TPR) repeat protein
MRSFQDSDTDEKQEQAVRRQRWLIGGLLALSMGALAIGVIIALAGTWTIKNIVERRAERERIERELQQAEAQEAENKKSVEEAFFQGKELFQAGRYQDAINALDRAVILNPNNAEAALLRGRCFVKLKDNILALQDFTRAITADEKNVEALDYRTFIYLQEEMYPEAAADADRLIVLAPKNGRAYKLRSDARYNLGDMEGASEDAKQSCTLGYADGCEAARRLKRR